MPSRLPYPAASRARLMVPPPTPKPAATENRPTCSWPCVARPRRQLQFWPELSISIDHLPESHAKTGNKILRLQEQYVVSRHRRQQIDRLAPHPSDHILRITERQPKESDQPTSRFVVEIAPRPEQISDR